MLRSLRIRLTLVYLAFSIFLAALVGGSAYSLVRYYLQASNDEALKAKVGVTLMSLGLPLSSELKQAVAQSGFQGSNLQPIPSVPLIENEDDEPNDAQELNEHNLFQLESSLADIYILPLTVKGEIVPGLGISTATAPVNLEAISAAQKNGTDMRTFTNSDGDFVRIYTYLVNTPGKFQVFQSGRFLTTQHRLLDQILKTMILAGGLITFLFVIISWFLAGRTIKPSLEAWDKQQSFITNASHELRTPLTLVHAGVELGLRKSTDPEQKELLTDVLADTDYMKKLIEDLLLISRMDAHSLKIEIEAVPLASFITNLTRQLNRVAENQDIKIETSLEDISIQADPVRLKQVLLIAMDNALRISPPDSVVLIECFAQKNKGIIKITDHGQGIEKKDLKKVFERFFKVEDRSSQEYQGSGLGLSIAKGLVEAQKGKITLMSKPGKWTAVSVSFPLSKISA